MKQLLARSASEGVKPLARSASEGAKLHANHSFPRLRFGLVSAGDASVIRRADRIAGGRRGFTLTELLVVIAILAILASLTAVGVMRALDTAKQTRIKVEVDNLDAAFKAYKEKYGSYPPCDLSFTTPTGPNYQPNARLSSMLHARFHATKCQTRTVPMRS